MHHSRLCSVIIDCRTEDLDGAAAFWSAALGRAVNLAKTNFKDKYRVLDTPPNTIKCEVQRVDHPSRVHLDIETDNIEAEVARLVKLGAKVTERVKHWVVMEAPTGQRFCVVPSQLPDFPQGANQWD